MDINLIEALLNNFKRHVNGYNIENISIKYNLIGEKLLEYEIYICCDGNDKYRITHQTNLSDPSEIFTDKYFKIEYYDECINEECNEWVAVRNEFNNGVTYDNIIDR